MIAREVGEDHRVELQSVDAPLIEACDDTSIATVRTPRSTSARRTRCSSTGPGVVRPPPPGSTSPSLPTSTPSVPIDALDAAPSSNRWRRIDVVVVLPFVPVTPSRVKLRRRIAVGVGAAIAAASPALSHDEGRKRRALRVFDDGGRRTALGRSAEKVVAIAFQPRIAMNRSPRATFLLSSEMPLDSERQVAAHSREQAVARRARPYMSAMRILIPAGG